MSAAAVMPWEEAAQNKGGAPPAPWEEAKSSGAQKTEEPGFLDKEIPLAGSWYNPTLSGVQSIGRGVRTAARGVAGLPGQAYNDVTSGRIPVIHELGEGIRSTAAQIGEVPGAIHDINQSPDPLGTYANAAQETAGQGAGQAFTALAAEGVAKAAPPIARAAKPFVGKALTTASDIVDPELTGVLSPRLANAQKLAGRVGRVLTKSSEEKGPLPEELDATAENKPYAGAPKPKLEKELDATGENKPFAGGMDEYVPPKKSIGRVNAPKETGPIESPAQEAGPIAEKSETVAPAESKLAPPEPAKPTPRGIQTPAATKPELVSTATNENGLDSWTIKSGGRSVGEVHVGFDKSQQPPQPYIDSISIVEDARHQGLGRQVLPQLEEKYGSLTSDPGGNTTPEAHSMWRATPGARPIGTSALGEPLWKIGGESAPAETTPAAVEQQLNDALGGKPLVRGVSLRNQPAAQAAAAGKLPEGFTPVESSVLRGYQYDPATQEFTAITKNGTSYTHGEVTPEQAKNFENADSQGKAWTEHIRNNNVLVKKNGISVKPATLENEAGITMPKSRAGIVEPETETYSQDLGELQPGKVTMETKSTPGELINKHEVTIRQAGKPVGKVTATAEADDPATWRVNDADLKTELQGRGIGKRAYSELFDHAQSQGAQSIHSDGVVSEEAARVWRSLKKAGEPIVETSGKGGPTFSVDLADR